MRWHGPVLGEPLMQFLPLNANRLGKRSLAADGIDGALKGAESGSGLRRLHVVKHKALLAAMQALRAPIMGHHAAAMESSADLAGLLRAALEARGMTAGDLTKPLGVSRQAAYSWTRTGRIAKKWLPKLAEVLGVPLGYFLGDESTMIPTDPREAELLLLWRATPDSQREALLAALRKTYAQAYSPAVSPVKKS